MISFLAKLIEQVLGVRALRNGYNDPGLSAIFNNEDAEVYIFAPISATDDLDDNL